MMSTTINRDGWQSKSDLGTAGGDERWCYYPDGPNGRCGGEIQIRAAGNPAGTPGYIKAVHINRLYHIVSQRFESDNIDAAIDWIENCPHPDR